MYLVGKAACSHCFKNVVKQKGSAKACCCPEEGLPRAGFVGLCVCSFSYPVGDYWALEEALK